MDEDWQNGYDEGHEKGWDDGYEACRAELQGEIEELKDRLAKIRDFVNDNT